MKKFIVIGLLLGVAAMLHVSVAQAQDIGTLQRTLDALRIQADTLQRMVQAAQGQESFSSPQIPLGPKPSTTPIITGINVSTNYPTSTPINWDTQVSADSKVWYGTSTLDQNASVPGFVTHHSVPLYNLANNSVYQFLVESVNAGGDATRSGKYKFGIGNFPSSTTAGVPVITSIYPSSVAVGQTEYVFGKHFTLGTTNKVCLIAGTTCYASVTSQEYSTSTEGMSFQVPQVPAGLYRLQVTNGNNGISNLSSYLNVTQSSPTASRTSTISNLANLLQTAISALQQVLSGLQNL